MKKRLSKLFVVALVALPLALMGVNNAVAQESLDVEMTVDPIGTVDPRTGEVTITGTLSCSQPTDFAYVWGQVRQRAGRLLITGYFHQEVPCSGETPWSATVYYSNGIFKPGRATVNAFADGCIVRDEWDYECDYDEVTTTIRLRSSNA